MNASFDAKLVALIQMEFEGCIDPREIADSIIESCVFHSVQAASKIMPTKKMARERIKTETENAFDKWNGNQPKQSDEAKN